MTAKPVFTLNVYQLYSDYQICSIPLPESTCSDISATGLFPEGTDCVEIYADDGLIQILERVDIEVDIGNAHFLIEKVQDESK